MASEPAADRCAEGQLILHYQYAKAKESLSQTAKVSAYVAGFWSATIAWVCCFDSIRPQ